MCATCWEVTVDDAAVCAPCVPLLTRAVPLEVPLLGAAVVLLVLVRVAWLVGADNVWVWSGAAFLAILTGVAAWRLTAKANQRRRAREVAPRPRSAGLAVAGHPYRGALVRSARRLAPPVSGAMAVFVVASALLVTAFAIPAALRLPRWLELELIVAAWWLVWTVTFSVLLYRGWRVARDPS